MSTHTRINRIRRRMFGPNGNEIMSRRFKRSVDRIERRHKSDAAHIIWEGTDWHYTGGRGLIHKGRKP